MGRTITTEQFIERAMNVHKDKYDYSKVAYTGSTKKITIICKVHGEFEQLPYAHLSGNDCVRCGKVNAGISRIMGKEEFIRKAIKVHGEKYSYEQVDYEGTMKNVIIICKSHGDFIQKPVNHLMGRGCKYCSILNASDKRKMGREDFIEKAIQTHGYRYDYTKVEYKSSKLKVTITCNEHGDFNQIPNDHIRGHGCSSCGIKIISEKKTRNNDMFIEKAIMTHGKRYDYSKVDYVKSKSKVIIICPRHGEFKQVPQDHERGIGCSKCASEDVRGKMARSNTTDFIQKSNSIHNNKYDYSLVNYINNHENVTIICDRHGEFQQKPNSHLSGNGCSLCKNKTEGLFNYKIKEFYPSIVSQFRQDWCRNIRKLPFDFCIPEYKIIIELDGAQHFAQVGKWKSPEEQLRIDKYKEKCANDNHYSTIRLLQSDVFYNKYDWSKEICDAIENIKENQIVKNIYLCKNNEYEKYMATLTIEASQ